MVLFLSEGDVVMLLSIGSSVCLAQVQQFLAKQHARQETGCKALCSSGLRTVVCKTGFTFAARREVQARRTVGDFSYVFNYIRLENRLQANLLTNADSRERL
jgi:hypothetical protein